MLVGTESLPFSFSIKWFLRNHLTLQERLSLNVFIFTKIPEWIFFSSGWVQQIYVSIFNNVNRKKNKDSSSKIYWFWIETNRHLWGLTFCLVKVLWTSHRSSEEEEDEGCLFISCGGETIWMFRCWKLQLKLRKRCLRFSVYVLNKTFSNISNLSKLDSDGREKQIVAKRLFFGVNLDTNQGNNNKYHTLNVLKRS